MCYILGIESSCDETAAAVTKNGREIKSNIIYSQAQLHYKYGGVVPEIASRKHIEKIIRAIDAALNEAGISLDDLDAVAVTNGPGLVGALLVGVSVAKAIAYAKNKPLVPVNHIHGHIAANYIANRDLEPPFVCLVASGGHSHIIYAKGYHDFEVLGATRDDAAGEAFDKVARVLGLGYPGGPALSGEAEHGNPDTVHFPRASNGLDFSFSGVKTAVINYIHNLEQKGEDYCRADIAASFQKAVVEVLVKNTIEAAKMVGAKKVCLAGGVASNYLLRSETQKEAKKNGFEYYSPPLNLCTDNAAMIACAGYYNYKAGLLAELDLNAVPQLESF